MQRRGKGRGNGKRHLSEGRYSYRSTRFIIPKGHLYVISSIIEFEAAQGRSHAGYGYD
jgi:hypothetical protein